MNIIKIYLIISFVSAFVLAQNVDQTLVPNTKGIDVVDAVVKKIRMSRMFPEDKDLLLRIACAETQFGESARHTVIKDSSNGIWNLNQTSLKETQNTILHPSLSMIHYKIIINFGINWLTVSTNDLLKPFYSGLASRLYLHTLPETIPENLIEQANFWKKYYHKSNDATVNNFITDVNTMQNNFKCQAPNERCIVLDGSGSIDNLIFENCAKKSVYNITLSLFSDSARFCLILFDHRVEVIYSLENQLSRDEMLAKISNLRQPYGSTNTGGAISRAVDILKTHQRQGCPKNMLIITDGHSNAPKGVQPGATDAKTNGIINMVFGIGKSINQSELLEIANGKSENIMDLQAFCNIENYIYRYRKESCSLPQTPQLNTEVVDKLFQNEKRYYKFEFNSNNILVTLRQILGNSVGFYSYTDTTPSSALNNGHFTDFISIPKPNTVNKQVFIAIEGLKTNNNYAIKAQPLLDYNSVRQ